MNAVLFFEPPRHQVFSSCNTLGVLVSWWFKMNDPRMIFEGFILQAEAMHVPPEGEVYTL
jgi:hypothetical protein